MAQNKCVQDSFVTMPSRLFCSVQAVLTVIGVWSVVDLILFRLGEGQWTVLTTAGPNDSSIRKKTAPLSSNDSLNDNQVQDWNTIPCPGTSEEDRCDLTDAQWGVPTVLLSFGRSGSTVTWDTLAGLAVSTQNSTVTLDFQRSIEDLGKSEAQTVHFFDDIDPSEHGKCALERILCKHQRENKQRIQQRFNDSNQLTEAHPGIYGTKWKPFEKSFGHAKSREALAWLGVNPHIKVLHNQRNLLDVFLSRYKHEIDPHVPAHCFNENSTCLQKHLEAQKSLVVPIDTLLEELGRWEQSGNQAISLLEAYHVTTLRVQYELLYYADNADEWNRAMAFLLGDHATPLTISDVQRHIEHVATSSNNPADKIANFEEVAMALQGTMFAKYLPS